MGLGSEIRDPEKTYSGSRGQKGTGSRIPDPQNRKSFLSTFIFRQLLAGLGVNLHLFELGAF
jgi:hypothetical protein